MSVISDHIWCSFSDQQRHEIMQELARLDTKNYAEDMPWATYADVLSDQQAVRRSQEDLTVSLDPAGHHTVDHSKPVEKDVDGAREHGYDWVFDFSDPSPETIAPPSEPISDTAIANIARGFR